MNRPTVKKVLVVNDEPALREVVSAVLIDEGYDVAAASDGRMALGLLAEERPDLILMDVWMPGLSGHDAFSAMRARPDVRNIPVVMMSAAATQASMDPSIAGFLRKPFDLDRLLAIITRLIGPANAVPRP